MKDFKIIVAESLKQKIEDLSLEEIASIIEVPKDNKMGDYAFPCFRLAKLFRKSPVAIAEEIAKEIEPTDDISKIENVGGYLNFFVNKSTLAQKVITTVLKEGDEYGKSDVGKGKTVVIDYSSPNIAKPFHIGHIRTTVIGNALYKFYKSQGYDTVRINHLGDYGTQFGKLIVAFKLWGDAAAIEANPIKELLKLYVKFHDEALIKPELDDEARDWFTKLENGDEEALKLWQWFRDESMKEFDRVYQLLEIEFDSFAGESFYSDKMDAVIDELNEKGLLKESEGTMIVEFDDGMTPALIQKNDGSTLYLTRDLAAAKYRKATYDFDKMVYVVGSQQELHFRQLFRILKMMGYEWYKDMYHVQFGMVALESGTMSTRKGRVVFLEDVLNQAIDKTREIIMTKNPGAGDIDKIAKQVGVGAVVFQELSNSRIKDYTFSWDRTLSYDGETGPYVQYTHARCCAVLRKAGFTPDSDIDFSLISDEHSSEALTVLESFNDCIHAALRKHEPHIVTRYALDLAQAFNRFYHENPIILEDEALMKARLALVAAVEIGLRNVLHLLGMHAPERM